MNECTELLNCSCTYFLFRIFGPGSDALSGVEDSCAERDEAEDQVETFHEITPLLNTNEDYGRLPPHHCCASHTLNLLSTTDAEEASKNSQTYKRISRQVFAKCQALFNKQNKSSVAADVIQKHLGRYLLVPGATR